MTTLRLSLGLALLALAGCASPPSDDWGAISKVVGAAERHK